MKETTGYLLASINSTSDPFRRDALCAEMRGVIEKLEADAQALADVRTLDAWADANDCPIPTPTRSSAPPQDIAYRWHIALADKVRDEMRGWYGPTPEAARALAAAWVREQAKGAKP